MKKNVFKFIVLLLAGCIIITEANAQNIKTIPFGKNNVIKYDLSKGSYNVSFNGVEMIKNAVIGVGNTKLDGDNVYKHTKINFSEKKLENNKGQCVIINMLNEKNESVTQTFFIYPGTNYFLTSIEISGFKNGVNYLSPLACNASFEKNGDNRTVFVPFDNDAWIRYRSATLESTDFTSSEVATIYNSNNNHGLVIGSVQQTDWKSGISIKGKTKDEATLNMFAGFTDSLITRDRQKHGTLGNGGSKCSSPKFMVGYFDNWQTGLETYAKCIANEPPRYITPWSKAKPMGWNSWGVIQTSLNERNAKGVVDYFADSCKGFRNAENTLYIDLDSYWDNLAVGGIGGNISKLKNFANYCKQRGVKPGIYWAPLVDWAKQGNRQVEGSSYKYEDCWTKVNGGYHDFDGARAMDPTHPATQARMAYYIKRFNECGFEMVKIDFIGHASVEADYFYDKNIHTGMQAFCKGMECLTNEINGSMLVYVAISPNIITHKYAHVRRIACDAFRHMHETAYTLNSTALGWWQNSLYDYIDADHIVFSNEKEGANRARLASSIVTGTVITGDDYSGSGAWKDNAKQLLQNDELLALMRSKNNFKAININTGDSAPNIFVFSKNGVAYIAVFNYAKEEKKFTIDAKETGLKYAVKYNAKELFSGNEQQIENQLNITVNAEDAMILKIKN